MAQFTKIKNENGTVPGFFGETLYRASPSKMWYGGKDE